MNKPRRILSGMCIVLLLFFLSGCAERPFLAKGGIYSIVTISPEGTVEKTPIQLTWNSNFAVMQKLLLEASFVLGDLHSMTELETDNNTNQLDLSQAEPSKATLLPSVEGEFSWELNDLLREELQKEIDPAISNNQDLLYQAQRIQSELFKLPAESKDKSPAELPEQPTGTIMLEATFPEVRPFQLLIDDELTTIEISSIQIEVIGEHPGLVILNEEMFLQGIPNPNLVTAFNDFIQMLHKTNQVPARFGRNLI